MQAIEGNASKVNYLDEFISEVENGTSCLTESVLAMTESCLKVQEYAGKK